jgi:protein involved in polysaccharide export with SLBB domain
LNASKSNPHRSIDLLCATFLIAASLGLVSSRSSFAQAQPQPSSASSSTTAAGSASPSASTDDSALTGVASRTALPAGQIIAILQEKPEVVIELKSLVADQLQQQGTPTQADSITDEMLFTQIASSADLRSSITTFLRARGYVSDADLHRSIQGSSGSDDDTPVSVQTLQSLSQIPGTSSANGFSTNGTLLSSGALPSASGIDGQGHSLPSAAGNTSARTSHDPNARSTTDEPQVLRRPAPYNLLSLRDLYTQLPEQSGHLKRFGSDVFLNRDAGAATRIGATGAASPLDVPIGPDYVVGPGDSLTIDMWGGISQSLTRVIDREGRISLPESGSVQVAGLTLERARDIVESSLKQQYRNVQVAVTVSRLRTVRVYVVGDVQRPGAYDISSLSTPLNALFTAGGPTGVGSLRTLQHFRGKELVGSIDLYNFLLHGVRIGDDRFQGGDTLLVPPAGPQAAVSGAVKRPAIYELKGETTLATLLDDAGGATVAASLSHITVERIDANSHRETTALDLTPGSSPDQARTALSAFTVKDGDRIHVAPILPYSERAIYLEGHVVRPGRLSYHDGIRLGDVLHSYQDLLPEPAAQGEIVRLVAPDLHVETLNFDVAEVLIGNNNIDLRPFDTIRILGRYEIDAPRVTVGGEVLRPGSYSLSQGMTAAQLVRLAGGFKRDALTEDADLSSYRIVDGKKAVGERNAVRIGDAVTKNDPTADVVLKAGDVLTIHQITGWNDIGALVQIQGEVGHPGSYGFQEGEHLSSVLRRAGGLRNTGYAAGAVLVRVQVRELEEKSRADLIREIETSSSAARLSPNLGGGDTSATLQQIQQQQEQVLARLRSQPATGRLVIHISSDIDAWANTPDDIEIRSGDVLTVPKRPGFVLVSGQVYNTSAITYEPGKTAAWYLKRAGGTNDGANRKDIFIIRANGSVVGRHSGGWNDPGVLATKLDTGDVVVVPQKIIGASLFWRNLLTTAQLASSVAITAAVAGLL